MKSPLGESLDAEDVSTTRPSELPLRLIRREKSRQSERTHAAIGQLAAFTGFALLKSRPEDIGGPQASTIHGTLKSSERRLTRLRTEPWRRWAEGFTCFFFVIVGAPLAILAKTSDYWTTFGMCFLPIILLYYPLYLFGLDQAKGGDLPPYGVWAGNVVLAGISSILMVRVRRY